jgi:hypothetical protein
MKKIILICASALFLSACADKQKYEEIVLSQMKVEQDLIDYKIDPAHMTKCVVELSTKSMPGLFPFDPDRMTAYKNYTKMLSMSTVKDKQKMLEELRSTFGSPKELANAHSNYTESVMNCLSSIVMESEDEELEAGKPEGEKKVEG